MKVDTTESLTAGEKFLCFLEETCLDPTVHGVVIQCLTSHHIFYVLKRIWKTKVVLRAKFDTMTIMTFKVYLACCE